MGVGFSRSSRSSFLRNGLNKYVGDKYAKKIILSHEEEMTRERCESSFYEFIKEAWIHIDGRPYKDGWHVQCIADHLQALYTLEIKNLLINAPPRHGKSQISAVLFPAWVWAVNPNLRFLYMSYSQVLSLRDSVGCRRLIKTEWYQKFWGRNFRLMKEGELRFDNNKHGYRISSSIGGTITGEGADFSVLDDPNSVSEIHSEVSRKRVHDFQDFVLPTRFSSAKDARKLLIMQRMHPEDAAGHALAKANPNLVHVCLPVEFERARICSTVILPTTLGKKWVDPRKREGELLWPSGFDSDALKELKIEFHNDSYTIAGQLQQRPFPASGGIIKEAWLKPWKQPDLPPFIFILQSWDTALTDGETSCYSACTTWGVFKHPDTKINNIMLLSVFREKVNYPSLRKMAYRLAKNYNDVYIDHPSAGENRPDQILIEAKVSGHCLLDDMLLTNLPVLGFNPNKHGNKIGRCHVVSHLMENGLVWLPTEAPNHEFYTEDSELFLQAAMSFPSDSSNDIIDSMTQAFINIKRGWVTNRRDPSFNFEESLVRDGPFT